MLCRMRAPTVTGQSTLAVTFPACDATSHNVGTLMSSAYQYHPVLLVLSGSNGELLRMPCTDGATPVTSVVWLGYVSVGVTPRTPLAEAPSAARRRRFGTLSPCRSASS